MRSGSRRRDADVTGRLLGVARNGEITDLGGVAVAPGSIGSARLAVIAPRAGAYRSMFLEIRSENVLVRVDAPVPPSRAGCGRGKPARRSLRPVRSRCAAGWWRSRCRATRCSPRPRTRSPGRACACRTRPAATGPVRVRRVVGRRARHRGRQPGAPQRRDRVRAARVGGVAPRVRRAVRCTVRSASCRAPRRSPSPRPSRSRSRRRGRARHVVLRAARSRPGRRHGPRVVSRGRRARHRSRCSTPPARSSRRRRSRTSARTASRCRPRIRRSR